MPQSTQFSRYLNDSRIQRVLNRKPNEEGFSLIELVVVIAVLAILAAVALPNFLGVQKDGQIAAAKNTLATIVKECVTQGLRQGTTPTSANIQADNGKLNGYTISMPGADCYSALAEADGDTSDFTIEYDTSNGDTAKTCDAGAYNAGCFTDSTLTTLEAPGNNGSW